LFIHPTQTYPTSTPILLDNHRVDTLLGLCIDSDPNNPPTTIAECLLKCMKTIKVAGKGRSCAIARRSSISLAVKVEGGSYEAKRTVKRPEEAGRLRWLTTVAGEEI
jgi:hypothetical protein